MRGSYLSIVREIGHWDAFMEVLYISTEGEFLDAG
jgi:hypothetical protein